MMAVSARLPVLDQVMVGQPVCRHLQVELVGMEVLDSRFHRCYL